MKNRLLIITCLLLSSSVSSYLHASEQSLSEQAKVCTALVQSRLERLACFDTVFGTAISETIGGQTAIPVVDKRPKFWHQVVALEKQREVKDVFVSNYNPESIAATGEPIDLAKMSNIMLSQSAMGTLPPRPILVISCKDNITRLQILLHKPIDEGMTPLSLVIDGESLPSRWFSESNGYLIRAGRGLPGIQDIRAMFAKKSLVIRSKVPELDNLSFDLSHLVDAIKPLRQSCHW